MYERIADITVLHDAFKAVKANRGCSGMDKITIAQYEQRLGQNLQELSRTLIQGKYQPLPVKRVLIPKPNGTSRPLGIPAVRDRTVQQALLNQIEPYLEPLFAEASYGFRPHRSALQAIQQVQEYLDQGYTTVVDADIKDFFGTLNHQMLMAKVRRTLSLEAGDMGKLIWLFLKADIMEEGKSRTAIAGTPQGGVISPILANLYLNDFDHSIEKTDWKLVRYADDFVILCKSVNAAVQAMKTTRRILGALRLELAPQKTRIAEYRTGFDFLGYHFQEYHQGHWRWPGDKATNAFKEKVRRTTRRQQPKNVRMVIEKLNPIIRGWGNYFTRGHGKKRFEALDSWIRMRLRSFIEKKKWPSGMNWKYPNDHFTSMGLVSLVQLYASYRVIQPSLAIIAQPRRRAVCGKSARTVR